MDTHFLGKFTDRIIGTREIPPRPEDGVRLPRWCHPDLSAVLERHGMTRLYSHQARMFELALQGKDVVITTGTASGKTLGFLLPVLQVLLGEPGTRAMLLYPTKALGQDQLRGLVELADGLGMEPGVYDGDTPPEERRRIRQRSRLILTNPDMLHSAFLPNHGRRGFSSLFRNLRFLVVDEMHVYRGAFGAHFANVIRRLWRLTDHYGSRPTVLTSSATIANPRELASKLFDREFELVDQDGSPSGGKLVHFWLPPLSRSGLFRLSVVREAVRLATHLVQKRVRFILFCRSRKETEVVLKETRDALRRVPGGYDESRLIAAYRGGYKPLERRKVERDLAEGRLVGVVSTNALELGIDIGQLEVAIQAGFPGTRASFWQQLGRAGRRGTLAHGILILAQKPVDQYIGMRPDWLMDQAAEHAVVDPHNLMIQLAHARAAAAELPLTLDDVARFPDLGEIVSVLSEAGELREMGPGYQWSGPAYPAGQLSLRNIDRERFKIVDRTTGRTVSEMDRPQTFREAFPRAVYLHDGAQYLVEDLDMVGHVATVRPVDQNYYTVADVRTTIEVLSVQQDARLERVRSWFGDVRVTDGTVGYKMLEFHTHQNLGYEAVEPELSVVIETEAAWFTIPKEVVEVVDSLALHHSEGMSHAIRAVARMRTMAERRDLQGKTFHYTDDGSGETDLAVILYDSHPGGLGYAARAFELGQEILEAAVALVEGCSCRSGCPACVGSYDLDKALVAWGLRGMVEEVEPYEMATPEGMIPWEEVEARWQEVVDLVLASEQGRGTGVRVLRDVVDVRVAPSRLVLVVPTPGLAAWMSRGPSLQVIEGALRRAVILPPGVTIMVEAQAAEPGRGLSKMDKLRRRHHDLVRSVGGSREGEGE